MAQFIADIQGKAGEASRLGSKKSGIRGHLRGWNVGVRVHGYTGEDGTDHFVVYLTSGSNGRKQEKCIGEFTADNLPE